MRRSTPSVRLLRAAALAVIIAGFSAHPVAAKVPYFTVDITPTTPVAGEPIQVVVRFWLDAGHTIAAPFDWERTMEDLIVMRPGRPGPEVPVALQLREPGRFEATVTLQAGEWTMVAFPDRTGWATAAVPVGYPDTIPLTVRESVAEPPGLVVPLLALALVVLAGALRLRSVVQVRSALHRGDTQVT